MGLGESTMQLEGATVRNGKDETSGVKKYIQKFKKNKRYHRRMSNVSNTGEDAVDGQNRYEMVKVLHDEALSMRLDLYKTVQKYKADNFTDPNYSCRLSFTMFELPGQDSPYFIIWPCRDPIVLSMLEKILENVITMLDLQPEFLPGHIGLDNIRASMKSSESTLTAKRKKLTQETPWKPTKQTTHELNDQANLIPLKFWPVLKNGETDIVERRQKLVTFALLNDMFKFATTYKNATYNLMDFYK